MDFISRLRSKDAHEDTRERVDVEAATKGSVRSDSKDAHHDSTDDKIIQPDAQVGVQKMQAATTVWTKWNLVAAYGFIWLIYVVTSLQEVVVRGLNPYVTSAFQLHSLTSATNIMSNIIGGLSKIPLAKILDTWGRPQGMALMLFFWVLGYIMMAACNNVETYAAAQVFSAVGAQGVSYCLTVFIADTSSLRNRGLMLAFATTPYVATTWIGGPVTQSVLNGPGWRWGFGIFTIIVPVVVIPLITLFLFNHRKAECLGLLKKNSSNAHNLKSGTIKHYAIEVDALGILLLAAGMALFLLPFSLYSYQPEQWRSPMIICMIVFGGILLIAFVLYEKFLAPVTFIPYSLLLDRTVFLAGVAFIFTFFTAMVWGSYFFSMLQVVWNLNITNATYISNIYRVGQCLWCLVVGVLIRYTGRFKWLNLSFGVPLHMLAVGLMIYFRHPSSGVGYVAMTQVFVSMAGGTEVICGELAMMAPSDHQHIAVLLAILNLFCSIGSAIGGTVATAVWTSEFPKALARRLPGLSATEIAVVYASLETQLSYAVGSPERNGISQAYADAQRMMLITSVCALAGALICVVFWRDIKVKGLKQVKGLVA